MAPRAVSAVTTFVVAILLALAVPVSQLRTVTITKSCCCPDPTKCHCPDHDPHKSSQSELRACHQSQHAHVAPTTPAFTHPVVAMTAAPVIPALAPLSPIRAPHAAPPPVRPDAPS